MFDLAVLTYKADSIILICPSGVGDRSHRSLPPLQVESFFSVHGLSLLGIYKQPLDHNLKIKCYIQMFPTFSIMRILI